MKESNAPVIPVYLRVGKGFKMLISQDTYRRRCSNGYIAATATLEMMRQGLVPKGCTRVLILRKGVLAAAPAADWTDVLPKEEDGVR
jgi:hypothetical protein